MKKAADGKGAPPGMSARLTRWPGSMSGGEDAAAEPLPVPPEAVPDILRRAAACYARAGWLEDACRAYERLGDDAVAARCHE